MKEKNMTALVSCFARCYHYKNYKCRVYSDSYAEKLLSKEEYDEISKCMISGISFFNKDFVGDETQALKWIVNNRLSPSVLARSAFCEHHLLNSTKFGCKEYLIYASGYDTFAYRNKTNLKVFELDMSDMIDDKLRRLSNEDKRKANFIKCDFTKDNWINSILESTYDKSVISFNSLLGISYYLTKDEFKNMIKNISNIISDGSSIVFDYPTYESSDTTSCNESLAKGSNNEMKSKYTFKDIEKILSDNNMYIYEHLDNDEMTDNYFKMFNHLNPDDKMYAPKGVNYCLAVKKVCYNDSVK